MVCLPPSSHHLVSFDVQESKLLHVYVQTTRLNQSVLCLVPLEHPAWQKNHPSLTVAKKKKQIPYSTFDLGAMRVSCYVFGYKPAGCLTQPLSWHQKWAWHWITILQFHAPPILTAPECCHGHDGPRWENPKGGTSAWKYGRSCGMPRSVVPPTCHSWRARVQVIACRYTYNRLGWTRTCCVCFTLEHPVW